jgi:hypothetical protein
LLPSFPGNAAMAAWRAETGLSEQATIGASTALSTLGVRVGKTAADFKPATAEMRKASVALDEVEKASGRAGAGMMKQMRDTRFDVMLAVGAVYGWLKLGKLRQPPNRLPGISAPKSALRFPGRSARPLVRLTLPRKNFKTWPYRYEWPALPLGICGIP